MIIALYALALAMIVGGLFAAVLGWDIVLVERGWTMVISGIIGASSGAVLIGITSIVSRLSRIQQEIARVQLSLEDDVEPVPATSAAMARGRIVDDVAAAATGLAGGWFGARSAAATPEATSEATPPIDDDLQPSLPMFGDEPVAAAEPLDATPPSEEATQAAPEPTEPTEPTEPNFARETDEISEGKVPDFLFAERYRETVVTEVTFPEREMPSDTIAQGSDTVDEQPMPVHEPVVDQDEVVDRKEVVEPAHEPAATSESTDDIAPAPSDEPTTVVGTYNSGDNKYVMYSDGSIEAETPQGFYRFGSLDELKEFIASGGEGGSPSAT